MAGAATPGLYALISAPAWPEIGPGPVDAWGCANRMTIHLVEDDSAVRDSLMVLLRNMGHQVASYADGESFLRVARPGCDDHVIVDLQLPGISGSDVIKRLQALDAPPRIIAVSGEPQAAIKKQLRGMRVPYLLRKPLTADDIAACLAGRRADEDRRS
jgi:FixJ family two-component response regulator